MVEGRCLKVTGIMVVVVAQIQHEIKRSRKSEREGGLVSVVRSQSNPTSPAKTLFVPEDKEKPHPAHVRIRLPRIFPKTRAKQQNRNTREKGRHTSSSYGILSAHLNLPRAPRSRSASCATFQD